MSGKTVVSIRVYYSGGTIGMTKNESNLKAPIANMMECRIRSFPDLHDEEYLNSMKKHNCQKWSPNILAMPLMEGLEKRVLYSIVEYDPLLDSSNMGRSDWIRIAKDIQNEYHDYDGFVVLHGTDTLTYTASALSFMLENLGKPVVLTGAQISIFDCRNDARDNFVSALVMAGNYDIPEVCVAFNRKLYRGNRTIKRSMYDLQAFDSPNYPPLANLAESIKFDCRMVLPKPTEEFRVCTNLCPDVEMLRIFPSISAETVIRLLDEPTVGVVLQTYGEGNAPHNRKDLTDAFKKASDRGVFIINTTQCLEGAVKNKINYESGIILEEIGVICGSDIIPEAALCKLSYVLSKSEWDNETKKEKLRENLRGEITPKEDDEPSFTGDCRNVPDVATLVGLFLKRSTEKELKDIESALYPSLIQSAIVEENLCDLVELSKKGIDITGIADSYDEKTALHVACVVGAEQVVDFLMKNGADINVLDKNCHTPLMDAIENDRKSIVCKLVKAGAYLSCSSGVVANSIMYCVERGRLGALQCYHEAGADLGLMSDLTGRTAAHVAAIRKNNCIIEYLKCIGNWSSNKKDNLGLTPDDYIELMRQYDSKSKCDPN